MNFLLRISLLFLAAQTLPAQDQHANWPDVVERHVKPGDLLFANHTAAYAIATSIVAKAEIHRHGGAWLGKPDTTPQTYPLPAGKQDTYIAHFLNPATFQTLSSVTRMTLLERHDLETVEIAACVPVPAAPWTEVHLQKCVPQPTRRTFDLVGRGPLLIHSLADAELEMRTGEHAKPITLQEGFNLVTVDQPTTNVVLASDKGVPHIFRAEFMPTSQRLEHIWADASYIRHVQRLYPSARIQVGKVPYYLAEDQYVSTTGYFNKLEVWVGNGDLMHVCSAPGALFQNQVFYGKNPVERNMALAGHYLVDGKAVWSGVEQTQHFRLAGTQQIPFGTTTRHFMNWPKPPQELRLQVPHETQEVRLMGVDVFSLPLASR